VYSEEDLIRLLRAGDEKAFKQIFDQYYRPLTFFALKYLKDNDEALEIVQDFFVRLWTKHQDLNITFSLKMYLFQGIRNACLNYIEASKVSQSRLRSYSAPEYTHDNALEKMMVAEQEELLTQIIERLPAKCKEIFLMSRVDRLSNKDIAQRLNISIKTVEAQMSIALKRLRDLLITISIAIVSF
jgi:RNA polymerase sigma-70 factor (ECF subfamily)